MLRMVANDVLEGGVVLVMEAVPTASVWVLCDSDPGLVFIWESAQRAHPIFSTEQVHHCTEGITVLLRSMPAHVEFAL